MKMFFFIYYIYMQDYVTVDIGSVNFLVQINLKQK